MAAADDYRDAFAVFDIDNDGVISASELKTMMTRLGNSLTDAEVRDIISEAGSSATNSITAVQFNKLMSAGARTGLEIDSEIEMKQAFSLFDRDGDGIISPKEMTKALSMFGITLSDRETELLIAEATLTSSDKRISFDVFKKVMSARI
eukprot:CAMPEP_0119321836 /NCGR_PEP_ID=MMETSP1333-20130426/56576_1 /TAXON_ID=418940 /ORGANISM="Scyphosphaera apsteinii, Strain RCC1455" /LENGTH=148 /DNA_ID=CAMNT_0007328909 /DNA_START=20 /DNA_END=466 /DNA_ORIENTATION=+